MGKLRARLFVFCQKLFRRDKFPPQFATKSLAARAQPAVDRLDGGWCWGSVCDGVAVT